MKISRKFGKGIVLIGLILSGLVLVSCDKKNEKKSYYWVELAENSPIIQHNNYSYRLQNWAKGAIGNYCSDPQHFKGRVTRSEAFGLFYDLEDLMCHTIQTYDSSEVSEALEYYFYTIENRDISRHGLAIENSLTLKDMWTARGLDSARVDSGLPQMLYVYLRLFEIESSQPLLVDTVHLTEYKFHH